MAVELVSADFPVKYNAGKLSTLVDGFKRMPYGWVITGVVVTVLSLPLLPSPYGLLLTAATWGRVYTRRNSTLSKWRPIPREEIAEVKIVADESRVKIGSRLTFGIFATPSREALVSVVLRDGRKALFKTDRGGLTDMLALGH